MEEAQPVAVRKVEPAGRARLDDLVQEIDAAFWSRNGCQMQELC